MNKQNELAVWIDGDLWFEFPQANEQNVQDMLVRKGVSARCVILPKGETPRKPKVTQLSDKTQTTKQQKQTK